MRNDALIAEWEELARDTEAPPWLWPGWVLAWCRAFGTGRLAPVEFRRDGRLVALAPMCRANGALISPTNWHTPAFAPLAADADAERALVDRLFADGSPRVTLGFVPEDRIDVWREGAPGTGRRLLERTVERSPYIDTTGTWEDYAQTLDGRMRRELRRRRRLLERDGTVTFEVLDGGERLEALLDEGFAVEAAGWKGSGGTAILSDGATHRFYREVAAWAASRGWLRLAFLRLDGHALAFDLAIEAGGVHSLLKTGFRPEHRAVAPGKLLRAEMIARAFTGSATIYEFLGADEAWKLEWTDRRRELRRLDAFHRSAVGLAHWSAFTYGRPLAKRVRAMARL
jgi:CelD/BcsL family acetyltransferase involved in cellulose biosynthesis